MKFMSNNFDKERHMLVNMLYQRGRVDDKYVDFLNVIYKDLKTGEKKLKTIKSPEVEIYFEKEEYRDHDYNKAFVEIDKADKHTCKYKDLAWYIAQQAGDQYIEFIRQCYQKKSISSISNIHKYPYVFGSDLPIDMWYRIQWLFEYDNNELKPLTKLYLDIEVDTIDSNGMPEYGACPINAISLVDETDMTSYIFLLHTEGNPLIDEFISDVDNFIDELHDLFDESYGNLEYKIFMYKDERELIKDTFKLVNTLKRDFLLAWNGLGFDMPYIIERIKELGMKPEDIFCHKDFPVQTCSYHKDTRNFAIANKGDSLKVSSYTKYIDQMVLYAATRKGQGELRSNALTAVAKAELGDEKLDYTDEANIKTLPYVNYRKFVTYNLKDTLLQFGIERKVNDLENLYLRSYSNAVDYDKVFRQTVTLKSRAYIEFFLQGNVLGNNINVEYGKSSDSEDDEKKFDGAVVGDPLLNTHTGIKLFGKKSKYIYNNVIDMDRLLSLYTVMYIANSFNCWDV